MVSQEVVPKISTSIQWLLLMLHWHHNIHVTWTTSFQTVYMLEPYGLMKEDTQECGIQLIIQELVKEHLMLTVVQDLSHRQKINKNTFLTVLTTVEVLLVLRDYLVLLNPTFPGVLNGCARFALRWEGKVGYIQTSNVISFVFGLQLYIILYILNFTLLAFTNLFQGFGVVIRVRGFIVQNLVGVGVILTQTILTQMQVLGPSGVDPQVHHYTKTQILLEVG